MAADSRDRHTYKDCIYKASTHKDSTYKTSMYTARIHDSTYVTDSSNDSTGNIFYLNR